MNKNGGMRHCISPYSFQGKRLASKNSESSFLYVYNRLIFTKYYTNIVPSIVFWFEAILFPTFSSDDIKEAGSCELEAI
jgi:hypothetical protein